MKPFLKIFVLLFFSCSGFAAGFPSFSHAASCKNVMYVQCGSSPSETTVTTIQEAVWRTCSGGEIYVDSCSGNNGGYNGFAITGTYNLTIQPLPGATVQITGTGVYFNPKCTSTSCATKTAIYIAPQNSAGNIETGKVHDITIRGITITGDYTSAFVIREVTNTKINLANVNVNIGSRSDCVSSTELPNITGTNGYKYPLLLIRDATGTYNARKNWWGSDAAPYFKTNTPTYETYKDKPSLSAAYSGTITKTVNTSNNPIPGVINAITLTNVKSAVLASFNNAPNVCSGLTPTKYFDVLDGNLGTATPQQITLTVRDANAIMYYDVPAASWKPARPITPTDSWVMLELSNSSEPSLSQLLSGVTGTFFVAGQSSGSGPSPTTSSSSTTTSAATTTTTIPPTSTTTSVPPSSGGGGTGESTVPVLQTTGFVGFIFPNDDLMHAKQTQSFSITNAGGGTLTWSIGEPLYTGGSGWITAISPQAGSNSGMVQVTVDRSRAPQAAGRYEATIPVSSNGGSDNVLVRLTVQESGGGGQPPAGTARLMVSPQSVAFDPSATEQAVTAQNIGETAGSWDLWIRYDAKASDWLTVNPLSITLESNESEQIALLVNRNGLAPDTYSAAVDFIAGTDNRTNAATVNVRMEVAALPDLHPVLAVDKSVFFAGSGINSVSISIRNTGTGTLAWSTGDIQYSGAGGWLSVSPQSGSLGAGEQATITATVDRDAVPRFRLYRAVVPIVSNAGVKNVTILMWNPLFRR